MSNARITIEHSRPRRAPGSVSTSTTDDGTNSTSSPIDHPSGSHTSASFEFVDAVDEDSLGQVEEDDIIEPSESASRGAPANRRRHIYIEPRPLGPITEGSSHRPPAVPEVPPHRSSRREHREEREPHEHRIYHHQHRRRAPSTPSDSVGSHDEYEYARRAQHVHARQPHAHHQYVQTPYEQAGYAQSHVAPQYGYNPLLNPMAPGPMAQGAQLALYDSHNPYAYYQHNPLTSPLYGPASHLSSPLAASSNPTGYFNQSAVGMGMLPYPGAVPHYYPLPVSGQAPGSSDDDKFKKLQDLILAQEAERMAREKERQTAAEAILAKQAADKVASEALAAATKKAKEEVEAAATQKAKEAEEAHDKALKEAKEATEKAEKAAKAAKEEIEKAKPPDDATMMPIKFKDAVGRKFSFPWALCKTWKGIEELIKQAFLHVDVIGQHVQDGHYDLVGPDGDIILPKVWETTVKPGWDITMHMWPMEKEEAKSAAAPVMSVQDAAIYDWRGRTIKAKKKSKKPANADVIPPPPLVPMVPGMQIPPPPLGLVASDPFVAGPTAGIEVLDSKVSKKHRAQSLALPLPLAFFAGYGKSRPSAKKRP